MHTAPVVAIFNTNDDMVELLRVAFEQAGFIVVSVHIDDVRRGTFDLPSFIEQHNPQVIVYDVAPPYEPHWRFLEHVRNSPEMSGRQFILTSVNARQVYDNVGTREPIFEIVGKPYDIDQLTRAVKEASRARPLVRSEGLPTPVIARRSEARDQHIAPQNAQGRGHRR